MSSLCKVFGIAAGTHESPSSARGQSESPSLPKINEDSWGQKELFSARWSEHAPAPGLTLAP